MLDAAAGGKTRMPMRRLENWRIAPDFVKPRVRREATDVVIIGEAFDLGAGCLPDGTPFEFSIVAEPVAVEGAIVTEAAVLNTRWLLGAPASSEFLASELYKAHVEIDKLKEQLREKPSPARPRPRGRAPENCTWGGMARAAIDGSKGVWLHAGECCMRLECSTSNACLLSSDTLLRVLRSMRRRQRARQRAPSKACCQSKCARGEAEAVGAGVAGAPREDG